jgi:holo-[acyl-carrier protein] synthase
MALIIGIGTDIVAVERFAKDLSPRFLSRVFTEYELAYCQNKPPQTMAGLFAAKEAVVKAMGTGFAGFSPNAVEIRHDDKGKPYTVYGGHTWHISISHCEAYAVAFAVLTI